MYNQKTGLAYQGKNSLILQAQKDLQGFSSSGWLTFLQARELGYKVKKGSKATAIIKVVKSEKKKGDKIIDNSCVRFYKVFNLNQIETL
jgi:antirestriction protein ArdC